MLNRYRTEEGRTFTNALEKIGWVQIDGEKYRKAFTKDDFYNICSNTRRFPVGPKMFNILFKRAILTGEIVLDDARPIEKFMVTTNNDVSIIEIDDRFNEVLDDYDRHLITRRQLIQRFLQIQ
jgi:hypothetical protein